MMATMGSKAIAVTEHENKCPECLVLEISGEIVAAKGLLPSLKKSESEAIALFLRIGFNEQLVNEQWLNFSFGRVKFGLQGGELRLKLENGKMPSELRNQDLKKLLKTNYVIERQIGEEQENKSQDDQPVWVFENKNTIGQPVLRGLFSCLLGYVLVEALPCQVEVEFVTEIQQVVITGLENPFNDDISGSKLKAFELGIAKLFLKHKTQPYLSRQVLRYE